MILTEILVVNGVTHEGHRVEVREKIGEDALEGGALLGMAIGLLDGLRAVGQVHAPTSSSMVTLLTCVLGGGILGAIGLPLMVRLVRTGDGETRREPRRLGRVLPGLLCVGLFASIVAVASQRGIAYVLSSKGTMVRVGAAWLVTVLVASLAVRLFRKVAGRGSSRGVWLAAAAGSALVATVIVGGRPSRTALPEGPTPAPEASTGLDRPNVVLVVLDTVRADRLSIHGGSPETSPFLSDLARESTVYERAVSPAPWTLPTHASFFTGQFASVHQATAEHRYLRSEWVTAAEILRENGYETVGYSCNSVVSRAYNLDQGFDRFIEIFRYPLQDDVHPLLRTLPGRLLTRYRSPHPEDKGGRTVNAMVREWLDHRSEGPFFLFINYLEPHLPYLPPEPYRSRFVDAPLRDSLRWMERESWFEDLMRVIGTPGLLTGEDYEQLTALYDAELAYQDELLRDLVEELGARGLLDRTLLIVTSDHGENLGEHGLLNHVFSIHETLLHVPLVVRHPGSFPEGARHPGLVSTLSIFPTILEATGSRPDDAWPPALGALPRGPDDPGLPFAVAEYALPVYHLSLLLQHAPGFDLRPYAVRQRSLRTDDWKIVRREPGSPRLFDLAGDPNETQTLNVDENAAGETLQDQLDSWVDALEIPSFTSSTDATPLDDETRESLRSLGYVQ
jgi:arylsulfatase A-like enzyme